MTEERLNELIYLWQERLGLKGWRIAVQLDSPVMMDDRRVFARACRSEFFDRATIMFDRAIIEGGQFEDCVEADLIRAGEVSAEQYIEETVVHELLHLAMRNIMEASDLIRDDIHPSTRSTWDRAFRRAEEELCERTAISLVESFGDWDKRS
jgi:hypothetical protein